MKNDKWRKSIKFIIEEKFANGSSPSKFKMYEEVAELLQEGKRKEYDKDMGIFLDNYSSLDKSKKIILMNKITDLMYEFKEGNGNENQGN